MRRRDCISAIVGATAWPLTAGAQQASKRPTVAFLFLSASPAYRAAFTERLRELGCVDGFDQDEAESKRDERAVILRRLLASKCDTLEAFELADSLFNACPCLVECFRKEGGHILGVGSIRDCRTYSALARGVAI